MAIFIFEMEEERKAANIFEDFYLLFIFLINGYSRTECLYSLLEEKISEKYTIIRNMGMEIE